MGYKNVLILEKKMKAQQDFVCFVEVDLKLFWCYFLHSVFKIFRRKDLY